MKQQLETVQIFSSLTRPNSRFWFSKSDKCHLKLKNLLCTKYLSPFVCNNATKNTWPHDQKIALPSKTSRRDLQSLLRCTWIKGRRLEEGRCEGRRRTSASAQRNIIRVMEAGDGDLRTVEAKKRKWSRQEGILLPAVDQGRTRRGDRRWHFHRWRSLDSLVSSLECFCPSSSHVWHKEIHEGILDGFQTKSPGIFLFHVWLDKKIFKKNSSTFRQWVKWVKYVTYQHITFLAGRWKNKIHSSLDRKILKSLRSKKKKLIKVPFLPCQTNMSQGIGELPSVVGCTC